SSAASDVYKRQRITTADGRQCLLERGQSARFDASAILARGPAEGGESAWLDGRLEVRDRPLGEVLEALRAYRRGIVSVADDAAALRVSGIYPLDDSGVALALLEQSLPIRIDYHGPYWVSIASR
ncbi:iron dicitrate transport regulator FecR, partial [Pseudomonas aeruginosa]|nr:iron dicitrate transport regulator FecR [Pseudomonas aeruginosa]